MKNFIRKLQKLFTKSDDKTTSSAGDRSELTKTSASHDLNNSLFTEDIVIDLMRQVEETRDGMYTCAETFDLLDEYADLVQSNQDAEKLMPLVKAHLDVCPECRPEFETLINILESELSE